MNITVAKADINNALAIVAKALPGKSAFTILTCVSIHAENGKVTLLAGDGCTTIQHAVSADVKEPGMVVVSGRNLIDICKSLPGDVEMATDGTMLTVKSGRSKINLISVGEKHPDSITGSIPSGKTIILPGEVLKFMVHNTAFACASKEARPVFNGVYFEFGEKTVAVASNTHRMATATEKTPEIGPDESGNVIVPGTVAKDVASMVQSDSDVQITYGPAMIEFCFGDTVVRTRLIEGIYPNFRRVIPESSTITAKVKSNEFLDALKRAAIVGKNSEYSTVKLQFENESVMITATDAHVGQLEESVPIELSGEAVTMAVNVTYLLDYLQTSTSETITFRMTGPLVPCLLQDEDDSRVYIVTPVRMH
ncbi:DNA polymerase III subunit beta [Acetonema longum]|uniref:Beta sliding clamp n=1 Tax=Acetonema longum DSM 6540 TaxID=1009370 RepID=F7NKD5_9FIRM|nr:DNA polymerase III subunit beta [Acetonema longum]EGO63576.1 DNA polymerase III subunit beta [Acetonema longum DSM 6540]